jgi:hypothetical protein
MDGPPASVTSVLLGSPVVSPQQLLRSRISCCSPQVSCVSGAPDQVRDDEVPIPRLHVTSPLRPFARAAATLPADSDDVVPILSFSRCTALIWCYGDAAPSVSRLSSSTSLPIVCPQVIWCWKTPDTTSGSQPVLSLHRSEGMRDGSHMCLSDLRLHANRFVC